MNSLVISSRFRRKAGWPTFNLFSLRHLSLDKATKKIEEAALAGVDPEPRYWVGTALSYCGQEDAALRMLRSAVEHNYCAYSALQTDPLLVKVRGTTEFTQLLSAAKECQSRVLSHRNQSSP